MKKQLVLLVGLFCTSYVYATRVEIKTIDKIIDVLPFLEANLNTFNQTYFFSDIDEVLITVRKNQQTGVTQNETVEGPATKGFFDAIQGRAIGLTARPLHQKWSPLAYKTLVDQGFTFEASDLQVPLVRDQIIPLYSSLNQQNQLVTAGWHNGILYATYTSKKIILAHFLNMLLNMKVVNFPENIFFIDDQLPNINDVAALFSDEVAAGVMAKSVGLTEENISFLREKIKTVTLVHYRYIFTEAKRDAEEKFISALQEKINSAGFNTWEKQIAEMKQKQFSEYSFEQKKALYVRSCSLYDKAIDLLNTLNIFYTAYNEQAVPLYGPLLTDQSIQEQKKFLESNLLPCIYDFIESLRNSLYQPDGKTCSSLVLDDNIYCDFEDDLNLDNYDFKEVDDFLNDISRQIELSRLHIFLYKQPLLVLNNYITEVFKKRCFDTLNNSLYKLREILKKVNQDNFYTLLLTKIKVYIPNFIPFIPREQKTKVQVLQMDAIDVKQVVIDYSKNPKTWILLDLGFFQEVREKQTGYMLQELFSSLGQNIPTFMGITDRAFGEENYNNLAFDLHMHGAVLDLEPFGFNDRIGQDATLAGSVIYSTGMPYATIMYNLLKQIALKDVALLPTAIVFIGKENSCSDIATIFSDSQFNADGSPYDLQPIGDNVKDLICISYPAA